MIATGDLATVLLQQTPSTVQNGSKRFQLEDAAVALVQEKAALLTLAHEGVVRVGCVLLRGRDRDVVVCANHVCSPHWRTLVQAGSWG